MYLITFENNEKFHGGDLLNSKWNDIPYNKNIASIIYYFPIKVIVLSNYEAYNHLVYQAIVKGKIFIERIKLFAKFQSKIDIFEYSIKEKILFKDSCATKNMLYDNKVTGWKQGVKRNNPDFKMCDILKNM